MLSLRETFLPFHIPDIDQAEIDEVVSVLRSGWLTTGPKTRQFESEFASYVGAPHAVAVNSGTAALHLALDAIGLKEGDEVILPTLTFAATAEVVSYFKARPILVDCRADTLNIDPLAIKASITPKTRAIIPVHYGGQPCQMESILELARSQGIFVIEDAAHSLPASFNNRKVGTISDITCFSFYATKTLSTGEGGMATTSNAEYADKMRIASLHGISKDAWKRYTAQGSWYYEILRPGYKYNLTDVASAIGLVQLKKCDRMLEARKQIARRYDDAFKLISELSKPSVLPHVESALHLYVILLQLEKLRISRSQFIEELKKQNIGTSVHFIPLHLHPYYRNALEYKQGDFPNSEFAYDRMISLPIYSRMTTVDVDDVIAAVTRIIQHNRR